MKLLDDAFIAFSVIPDAPVTSHSNPKRLVLDQLIDSMNEKIANADSACLIDMYLKDFIRDMQHDYLEPTSEDRMRIEDTIAARTETILADPDLHSSFKDLWLDYERISFPYKLDMIARLPPAAQAASLPAISATLAP